MHIEAAWLGSGVFEKPRSHIGAGAYCWHAPSFTSSCDVLSATCRIVVSYDWSSTRYFLPDHLSSTNVITDASGTRYFLPDHLNSTNVLTDASGTVVEALDYYPYGSTRIDQTSNNFRENRQFVAQYSDPETNLSYLQARYYDGSKGDFLSEDPSFVAVGNPGQVQQLTAQDQTTFLSDPQQMNSYGYGRDNPIVNKDPTGNAFGIDDAAGFLAGGLIGVTTQTAISLGTQHQFPTRGELAGSFITGGIIGWGAVNTPETLGVSNAVSASITTGLIGGFYGDLAKQKLDSKGINVNQAGLNGLLTAGSSGLIEGYVPAARVQGYSAGPGNMYAVGKAVQTQYANGSINSISFSTGVKSAVGSQVAGLYKTLVGILTSLVQALVSQKSGK